MEIEPTTEVNWYVSRRVEIGSDDAASLRIPERFETTEGVQVEVGESLDYFPNGDPYRTYGAVLTIPGVFATKFPVELDILPFSEGLVELGLRPAARLPRFPIGPRRYFRLAWSVLDSIAESFDEARRVARAA
ncbi:MAG TPA: hypothetical protein VMU75_02955 [Acidimicrobiales bacterium]|nr:hypothetical protein [Acidimicrobiales bacterium]